MCVCVLRYMCIYGGVNMSVNHETRKGTARREVSVIGVYYVKFPNNP